MSGGAIPATEELRRIIRAAAPAPTGRATQPFTYIDCATGQVVVGQVQAAGRTLLVPVAGGPS